MGFCTESTQMVYGAWSGKGGQTKADHRLAVAKQEYHESSWKYALWTKTVRKSSLLSTKKKDVGSKRFLDLVLLDYIAFHNLMEIHSGILVLLVQMFPLKFPVSFFTCKIKRSLGKDKHACIWDCLSFLPRDNWSAFFSIFFLDLTSPKLPNPCLWQSPFDFAYSPCSTLFPASPPALSNR